MQREKSSRLPLTASELRKPFLATHAPKLDASLYQLRVKAAIARMNLRRMGGRGAGHGLPGKLVVSLTSFPKRFDTLHLTLRSLLTQSMRADMVILWIAADDILVLPPHVRRLETYGLQIRACRDIRSYTKIIPTLTTFPDAFVVTADDDIYYGRRWLERLVESWHAQPADVICHRAHLITCDGTGSPRRYLDWAVNVGAMEGSPYIFPTGVGGVLYAPHAFDPRVTEAETFLSLCPTTDDVWLYWMQRLAGANVRVLPTRNRLITWPGSQETGLFKDNVGGFRLNDHAVQVLTKHFGIPWADDYRAEKV